MGQRGDGETGRWGDKVMGTGVTASAAVVWFPWTPFPCTPLGLGSSNHAV